eukprot:COSAG02_NODE_1909_length_10419_cov_238.761725_3_plen_203_part_00
MTILDGCNPKCCEVAIDRSSGGVAVAIGKNATHRRAQGLASVTFSRICSPSSSGPVLLLLDRGILDFQAFCTADVWSSISSRLPPIHYDECVFLHSVAVDRTNLYETESNPARCHSAAQSKELHSQLLDIWSSSSVPVIEVPTTECLEEKLLAVARRCYSVTNTSPPSDFDVDERSLREDLRGLNRSSRCVTTALVSGIPHC